MDKASQLRHELKTMPEVQSLVNIVTLKDCLYIFEVNSENLLNYLNKILSVRYSSEEFFSDAIKVVNINTRREINRLFHNFLASALSLKDHATVFYGKYYEPYGKFTDYCDEVKKRFDENPFTTFVRELRNYTQHYKIPFITMCKNFTDQGRILVYIKKNDLDIEWTGWTKPSKEYISRVEDKLDLFGLVTSYKKTIVDFYEWVETRLEDIHREDKEKVKSKENEYLQESINTIPFVIHASTIMYKNDVNGRPEQIFQSLIPGNIYERILSNYSDPVDRMNQFILLIETATRKFFHPEQKKELVQIAEGYKKKLKS
jgi:hypothetical protein